MKNETNKSTGTKVKKIVKIVLITFLTVVILLSGLLAYFVRRPFPKTNGNLNVEGLIDEVTVIRDKFGIPNIYAENDHDLFFSQGYITAQDRLFQMEMHRRIGKGTVSQMLGEGGLDFDKLSRFFGLRDIAEKSLEDMDQDTLSLVQAYCDGINEYIDKNKNKLPLEFTILGSQPQQWEPLDVLSFCNYMAQINAYNINYELYFTQAISKVGLEMTMDEMPDWDYDNPEIITEELEAYSWKDKVTKETVKKDVKALMKENYESVDNEWLKTADLSGISSTDGISDYFQQLKWASGTWAVNGAHTETGEAILACDAHMSLVTPSFWYEVGLHGGSFDVSGFSLPGAPFILLGRNSDISWGFVNLNPDVIDLYAETLDDKENPTQYLYKGEWHNLDTRKEVIEIKGKDAIEFEIKETNHGPIINDWLKITDEEKQIIEQNKASGNVPIMARSKWESEQPIALKWAVQGGSNILSAVSKLNKAGNWDEFRDALSTWDSLGESFIYADKDGNVGYQSAAKIPIRNEKHLGVVPVNGSSGEYEWEGYIPFEELPSLYNPPTGYVAAINNKTTTDNYPYPFTYDWFHPGYRARTVVTKLDEMMAQGKKINVEDMRLLQANEYSYAADQIKDYIGSAVPENKIEEEALAYMKEWDGYFSKDSVGASIYNTWYIYMQNNTYADETANDELWGFQFPLKHIMSMVEIIKEDNNKWFDNVLTENKIETRDEMIQKSFKEAVTYLEENYGNNVDNWKFEKVQTTTLNHTVFAGIPVLGKLYQSKTIPFTGSPTSVAFAFCNNTPPDKFNVSFASTQKHIMSFDEPDYMQVIINSGESAHLFHKNRFDQMEMWANIEYYKMPYSKDAVNKAEKDTLILAPLRQ